MRKILFIVFLLTALVGGLNIFCASEFKAGQSTFQHRVDRYANSNPFSLNEVSEELPEQSILLEQRSKARPAFFSKRPGGNCSFYRIQPRAPNDLVVEDHLSGSVTSLQDYASNTNIVLFLETFLANHIPVRAGPVC